MAIDATTLIAFAVTNFLLNITPGPAVLRVVGDSLAHGALRGQATVLGILLANSMYCAFAALGLGAVLATAPILFEIIKWAGVVYLVWLGMGCLRQAIASTSVQAGSLSSVAASRLFTRSFLLQGANPKSVLFFGAMLPAFAGEAEGAAMRIIALGVIAILLEYPVLAVYSLLGDAATRAARSAPARRLMGLGSAAALFGAAAMVARTTLAKR
jgi:homoserine/homoserine lactone efflux protein